MKTATVNAETMIISSHLNNLLGSYPSEPTKTNKQMKYSPKLKKAMQQIKNIMDAEDIGGIVILHSPGHSEYLNKINPNYSCLKFEKVPDPKTGELLEGMRFRAKEEEVGKEKRNQLISDTANMLVHLNDIAGRICMQNIQAQELLETKFKIDKGDGGFSSLDSQNN